MKSTLFIFPILLCRLIVAQEIPYGYNESAGKYFNVGNNTDLYYEIYGEGPPLLMLHGGVYGYIDEFAQLIPKLAEKYQVICLASRGHVKSDVGTEAYTYEQRAEDAYKLIQLLQLKKVTVVGFSDGGFAAYKLAAIYPDVVEKMVVMGAGDDPVTYRTKPLVYTTEKLMSEYPDYFRKRVDNMPEPDRWDESLQMLSDMYNNAIVSNETFKKIKCPVLVMSGDNDIYAKVEECLKAHNFLSDSRLSIIPGCDHVILFCDFQAVWASMRVFLGYKGDEG